MQHVHRYMCACISRAHLSDVMSVKLSVHRSHSLTLSSLLFFISLLSHSFSSLLLSSLHSVLLSCFLHFPSLFSFHFTLPCSASTLPWQQSYRKSLLPRPRERSSFHRGRRDGEMEGWDGGRDGGKEIQGIRLRLRWRWHPHLFLRRIHPTSIRETAGRTLRHNVIEEKYELSFTTIMSPWA